MKNEFENKFITSIKFQSTIIRFEQFSIRNYFAFIAQIFVNVSFNVALIFFSSIFAKFASIKSMSIKISFKIIQNFEIFTFAIELASTKSMSINASFKIIQNFEIFTFVIELVSTKSMSVNVSFKIVRNFKIFTFVMKLASTKFMSVNASFKIVRNFQIFTNCFKRSKFAKTLMKSNKKICDFEFNFLHARL